MERATRQKVVKTSRRFNFLLGQAFVVAALSDSLTNLATPTAFILSVTRQLHPSQLVAEEFEFNCVNLAGRRRRQLVGAHCAEDRVASPQFCACLMASPFVAALAMARFHFGVWSPGCFFLV